MFLNFQDDPECFSTECQHQFMIGENLLVAPVVNSKEKFKKVYLPEGRWLELATKQIHDGKRWIIVEAPLSMIPLFIREGGVIPFQETQNFVGEKEMDELEFKIFPGRQIEFSFYEDDGETWNYKEGDYALSLLKIDQHLPQNLSIEFSRKKDGFESKRKYLKFSLFGAFRPRKVVVNGRNLRFFASANAIKGEGFCFEEKENSLTIRVYEGKNVKIDCF